MRCQCFTPSAGIDSPVYESVLSLLGSAVETPLSLYVKYARCFPHQIFYSMVHGVSCVCLGHWRTRRWPLAILPILDFRESGV